MEYPHITILTPVYQRHNFLKLYLSGIVSQEYPKDKISILIHECRSNEPFIRDLEGIRHNISPIQITHVVDSSRRTIGEKRNYLVKHCQTEYFMFFDSDDIYMPTALSHTVKGLMESDRGFAGSTQMLFCYPLLEFQTRMMTCGDDPQMIHEATICSTKSFFKKYKLKFQKSNQGESRYLLENVPNTEILLTNIVYLMMCLCHGDNTIPKDIFLDKKYQVDTEYHEDFKQFILSQINC
tara:strand:- start:1018 stop:1731 length:714 start_codon:yes stop_codon:yes gene_type:complete